MARVSAALARRLGLDPLIPRVAFVAATAAGGAGIALYLLAWLLIPSKGATASPAARIRGRRGSWQVAAGSGLLVLSLLLALRELGVWFGDPVAWPVVLAVMGAALIWRQWARAAAPAQAEPRRRRPYSRPRLAGPALGRGAPGVALVVGAGLLFLLGNDALGAARDVILAVIVVVGLLLILAPLWWRLLRSLAEERAERIRSQERAELAAHLHDSVLQTLALVQRRADEPRAVAALARRQERELRSWLSGRPQRQPEESFVAALDAAAGEIEEAHGVTIDLVAVGDRSLDPRAEAAAAREALVNAAKFAGEQPISVYTEASEERIQLFVRDRGHGFDLGGVPVDRRGIRASIVGRMERHGGRGISAKTVEGHVSAVLRKLQLSNRHELSRWAVERRLLGPEA